MNLISEDYLMHYGVKGMKWGVRHDPERVGRDRRKVSQSKNKKRKKLSEKQKRIIKIGAVVVGSALAYYGARKVSSIITEKYLSDGLEALRALDASAFEKPRVYEKVAMPNVTFDPEILKNVVNNGKCGKTEDEIDKSLLKTINHGVTGTDLLASAERSMNCGPCSVSYIMNSLFGTKCTAIEDYIVNFKHPLADGIQMQSHGKTMNQLVSSFKNVARTSYLDRDELPSVVDSFKDMKNGSTGILMVTNGFSSHFLNYEKSKNGVVTLVDTQNNLIGDKALKMFSGMYVREFADFSNAKIHTNTSMLSRIIMK